MPSADRTKFAAHRLLRARDWQDRPEFDRLCRWWQGTLGGVHALVGIGGAGKTAVVDRFLQVLPGGYPDPLDPQMKRAPARRADLPAIDRPFIFSFYDVPNEGSFFEELAVWLADVAGDCIPVAVASSRRESNAAAGSPGHVQLSVSHIAMWLQNLAHRRERTLLILDGLERCRTTAAVAVCTGTFWTPACAACYWTPPKAALGGCRC